MCRSGWWNYSTWLSLDFHDPRLVDAHVSETFEQKVLERAILGIFSKIFQKYFLAIFRAFLGPKTGPSNTRKGFRIWGQKWPFLTSGNPYWGWRISISAYLRALANPYVYWVWWKMRVGDWSAACGACSEKVAHVFHRVAHIFFFVWSRFFCNIVDSRCVQKLFGNAWQRIQCLQFPYRPSQIDNESVIRFRES